MIKYWASPSRAAALAILQLCPVANVAILENLKKIKRNHPGLFSSGVILQHNNATPQHI